MDLKQILRNNRPVISKTFKRLFLALGLSFVFCLAAFAIFLSLPYFFLPDESPILTDVSEAPELEVGIVFGAGVKSDGTPSDALRDRLLTAAELYNAGKIKKILVSGDNTTIYYNEPDTMEAFLIDYGIPDENVSADYAGRRTYDTCIRAKEIWSIDEAILVTQDFHLPRAVFTCEALGIESTGFSASRQAYVMEDYYRTREWIAMAKAVLDVYILKPDYIGGLPESL